MFWNKIRPDRGRSRNWSHILTVAPKTDSRLTPRPGWFSFGNNAGRSLSPPARYSRQKATHAEEFDIDTSLVREKEYTSGPVFTTKTQRHKGLAACFVVTAL